MGLIFTLAVIYFVFTMFAILKWPEISLGMQLFGKPIISMAIAKLGLGIGSSYFILALTFVSFVIYYNKPRSRGIFRFTNVEVAMLLLLLWGVLSLTFTPSPNYGADKMTLLALIGIPCLISARVFSSTPENLKLTLTILGWYSIVTMLFIIVFMVTAGSGSSGTRLKSAYFGALGLGYSSVAMTVFAAYIAIKGSLVSRGIALFSIFYSAIVLIIGTGSRGPVLALIAAVGLTFLRGQQILRTLTVGGMAVAVVYFVAINFASESGLARITGTDERDSGAKSTDSRLYFYQSGVEQFLQSPIIGQGTGSFSNFISGRDAKQYPHNYLIEVGGELGLIGLILFLTAMFICGSQIWRVRKYTGSGATYGYWEIALIQTLFFAGLLMAMFSFDMSRQRMFHVGIGFIAAITQWGWRSEEVVRSPVVRTFPADSSEKVAESQ